MYIKTFLQDNFTKSLHLKACLYENFRDVCKRITHVNISIGKVYMSKFFIEKFYKNKRFYRRSLIGHLYTGKLFYTKYLH